MAHFKEKQDPDPIYTVRVGNDGNGSAEASLEEGAEGTEVTLSASANDGYEFDRWEVVSGGITINNDAFTIGTKDVEIKAHFKETNKPDPKPQKNSSSGGATIFTGTAGNPVTNGRWTQDASGVWHYTTIRKFSNTWGYIVNPYAAAGHNSADWFYFDASGNMLTGWQLIQGKWYYLNPSKDGTLGACQLGGVTPDGWTVDESGAWVESIPKK